MNGEMVFAQFGLQQMMRLFRNLEHSELGLLMRIALENCLMQGPLKLNNSKLPGLLGCKTRKTFLRQIEALKNMGVIRETEEGLIADIAETAIEHFQKKSKDAARAVSARKDRQMPCSETEPEQAEISPVQGEVGDNNAASFGRRNAVSKVEGGVALPIDRLIEDLKHLAESNGQGNLSDELYEFSEKRLVETWLTLPLSPEKIADKVTKLLVQKNKIGGGKISSWKYFDPAIKGMVNADAATFQ
tara:strand:- start:3284 stop:4018 length:735 start_codon:yes stop_codon:yes gene_type:complete